VQFFLPILEAHREIGRSARFPEEIEVIPEPLALIEFRDRAKKPVLPFESERSSCY